MHQQANRGELGYADHDHRDPIAPAADEGERRAELAADMVDESALPGVAQRQLAEAARDDVDHDAAQRIGRQQCRTGHVQRLAGAQEQPGTDSATKGQKLDLTP